jgi:hypothetical protein
VRDGCHTGILPARRRSARWHRRSGTRHRTSSSRTSTARPCACRPCAAARRH